MQTDRYVCVLYVLCFLIHIFVRSTSTGSERSVVFLPTQTTNKNPKIAINSNSTQCVLLVHTVLFNRVSVNNASRKELQYGVDDSARSPME